MADNLQSEVAELRKALADVGREISAKLEGIVQTQADLRVQLTEAKADMRVQIAETKAAIAEKNSNTSARVAVLWGAAAAIAVTAGTWLISKVLPE